MYLTLEVAQGDLTIMVPAENVEEIGVRDVVDQAGLENVFEVLRTEQVEEPTNWSRRYKANQERLLPGTYLRLLKWYVTSRVAILIEA